MVTTPAPAHPLRAGAVPATLWVAGLLANLVIPILLLAVALPELARLQNDPARFLPPALAWLVVVLALTIFARWSRASLRMRTPGAMRLYDLKDPGHGPRTADLIAVALRAAVFVVSIVLAARAIDTTDTPMAASVLLVLGGTGGYVLPTGVWDAIKTLRDRLPGWRRELLFPAALGVLPGGVATASLILTPASDARAFGRFAWILALGVALVLRALKHEAVRRQERAMSDNLSQDAASLVEAISTIILSHTNPAPTLVDRQRMERQVRIGIWVCGIFIGLTVIAFGLTSG